MVVAPQVKAFPIFKVPPQQTSPPVDTSPTTIRTLWKSVSRPLQCAKSSHSLYFVITSLVVAAEVKAFPIFRIPPQQTSPPVDASPTIIRTLWKSVSRPLQRAESSHCLRFAIASIRCVSASKSVSDFPFSEIRPNKLHHPLMHHQLQLERFGRVF